MPSKRLGGKTGGRMVIPDGNCSSPSAIDRIRRRGIAQRLDTHLGKVLRIGGWRTGA
jgi:hypothetical protein